jgi:hypothetical protein
MLDHVLSDELMLQYVIAEPQGLTELVTKSATEHDLGPCPKSSQPCTWRASDAPYASHQYPVCLLSRSFPTKIFPSPLVPWGPT